MTRVCFFSKSKCNYWPSVTLWSQQDPIWELLTTQAEGLQATSIPPGHSLESLSPCVSLLVTVWSPCHPVSLKARWGWRRSTESPRSVSSTCNQWLPWPLGLDPGARPGHFSLSLPQVWQQRRSALQCLQLRGDSKSQRSVTLLQQSQNERSVG